MRNKKEIIDKFKIHQEDSGSYEVQIGLLNNQILNLVEHLKQHKKDFSSKRSLLRLIAKRKKLLRKLAEDSQRYQRFIEKLK